MTKIAKLFFVDTETTGLNPDSDQVIEIAASVCNIGPHGEAILETEYHALIRPMVAMSEFSARNFAAETWDGAVSEPVAVARLLNLWRESKATWIGQNPVKFDWAFLQRSAAYWHLATCDDPKLRAALQWPDSPDVDYHVFDLASMMLPIVNAGECEGVSLRNSRIWAGLTGTQTHRAQGDVSDMIRVYNAIQEREHNNQETLRNWGESLR